MKRPLRLLLVEDSEGDARLLLRQLRQGGFDVTCERVDTAAEMGNALASHPWDVIITDYDLPRFSGPAALRLAAAEQSAIPCIMVSDEVDQEVAEAAVRAGARRYITKDRLEELPAAVEQELARSAERAHLLSAPAEVTEAAQEGAPQVRMRAGEPEGDSLVQSAFEQAPVGMGFLGLDGRWLAANRELLELYGYSEDELLQRRFEDVAHPDDRAADLAVFEQLLAGSLSRVTADRRYVRRDGSVRWSHLSVALVRNVEGEAKCLFALIHDTTDRKQAEHMLRESEQRYRRMIELSPEAIAVQSEGKIVYANPAAMRLAGAVRAGDLLGRSLEDLVHPDSRSTLAERMQVLHGDDYLDDQVTIKLVRSDGQVLDVEISSAPMTYGGKPAAQIVFRDVTERARADQRRDVQFVVSRVLADADDVDLALRRVLEAIGGGLGWSLGGLWTIDPGSYTLVCSHFWRAPGVRADAFESACRRASVPRGNGVIGRVWQTGEPLWVADIVSDVNYRRFRSALTEGLRGAFSFPIRAGGTVLGVLDFFSYDVRPPEQDLLWTAALLSEQIGEFILRRQNELYPHQGNGHGEALNQTQDMDFDQIWPSEGFPDEGDSRLETAL